MRATDRSPFGLITIWSPDLEAFLPSTSDQSRPKDKKRTTRSEGIKETRILMSSSQGQPSDQGRPQGTRSQGAPSHAPTSNPERLVRAQGTGRQATPQSLRHAHIATSQGQPSPLGQDDEALGLAGLQRGVTPSLRRNILPGPAPPMPTAQRTSPSIHLPRTTLSAMHDTFMSYFQSETSDQAGEEQSPLLPPNQNEQHAPQNTVSESIGQEQQPPPAPPPAPVQAQPPSLPNPPPPAAPVPQYPQPAAPTQGQDQNAPLYGGSSSNRSTLNEIEQVDVTGQGQEEGRPMDTFSNVARNLTHELNQLSPQDQAHATNMLQDPEFLKNLLQFGSPGSQNDDEANPHIRRPLVDLLVSSANAIIADVRQEIDAYLCTEEFHQTLEGRIDEVFTKYLLDPSITTNMVSLLVQRPEFTDRLDLIVESIVQRSLARNQPDPPPPESVSNASSARKKGKTKVEQSPPLASWLQDLKDCS